MHAALVALEAGGPGSGEAFRQVLFEARVRRRLAGGGSRAPGVAPTKQVSVLPWVGLACGALLLAVGGALGGGVVLVGVAALAVFVFGVAFAGSRIAHRRVDTADAPEPVPAPASVIEILDRMAT